MIIEKTLTLSVGNDTKTIYFGMPDSDSELSEMYKLRHKIYTNKGFIDKDYYNNDLDKDDYDEDSNTVYFLAKIDGRIIGSVRMICCDILPTEKIFSFEKSERMKNISTEKKCEISRLVVDKYNDTIYLPRNVIMLFLIDLLVSYALKNNIKAGYSFIKRGLLKKLSRLRVPIVVVKEYSCNYPKNGVLYKYFTQQDNEVAPAYFDANDIQSFIENVLNNSRLFDRNSSRDFVLKENMYNTFLKKLKIL